MQLDEQKRPQLQQQLDWPQLVNQYVLGAAPSQPVQKAAPPQAIERPSKQPGQQDPVTVKWRQHLGQDVAARWEGAEPAPVQAGNADMDSDDEMERPWHAIHHWEDPGVPPRAGLAAAAAFRAGESGIERHLAIQVAACIKHNPAFLREMQHATEHEALQSKAAGPVKVGTGAAKGKPAPWKLLPSVQELGKNLRNSDSVAQSSGHTGLHSGPRRWGQQQLQQRAGRYLRSGGGGDDDGSSYDPDEDESYSDEVASTVDAALEAWQLSSSTVAKRLRPRHRLPKAVLVADAAAAAGSKSKGAGKKAAAYGGGDAAESTVLGASVPAEWAPSVSRQGLQARQERVDRPQSRLVAGAPGRVWTQPAAPVDFKMMWRLPWVMAE